QYEQQNTVLTDVTNVTLAEVGTGTAPLYLGVPENGSRAQYLYTAEELTAAGLQAGPISALELDVVETGGTAAFLRLRLQHVQMEELTEGTPITNGFTEVYFQSTTFPQAGWVNLPFYQDFEWDGSSDILLDVSKTGASPDPEIVFAGSSTEFNMGASPVADDDHYLALNGGGWAEVPPAALGMSSGITITFWTYGLPSVMPVNSTIFEAVDGANRRQFNVHLPWSDGNIYWDCGNDGSGYDRIFKAADPTEFAGQWHHWAFTKDVASGTMSIYLNGELWHSGTDRNRPIVNPTSMNIGANASGSLTHPGHLDNFTMWQSALTAEEIQQIMFTTDIPNEHPQIADLILHYPMDEG
ncbi:MAG: LamG domain-containing protein, partial [Bacteroidota bacterium]